MIAFMGRPAEKPARPGVVGANVRRLRTEVLGISQDEFARRAGPSRSTVASVELGKYGSLEGETTERLAKGARVTPAQLMTPVARHAPLSPLLEQFRTSPWYSALSPTKEEMAWLSAQPEIMWSGVRATPETVAEIPRWRRNNRELS